MAVFILMKLNQILGVSTTQHFDIVIENERDQMMGSNETWILEIHFFIF